MTAPKMTAKEALKAVVENRYCTTKRWEEEFFSAVSVLTDLAEENERLKQKWVDSMGDHVAVSVEAEELQARAEKAEADLARYQPVIDAVEKAELAEGDAVYLMNFRESDEEAILDAALSCREKVKP